MHPKNIDMFPTYLCFVVYFQSSILPHFLEENSSNQSGKYLPKNYMNLVGTQVKTSMKLRNKTVCIFHGIYSMSRGICTRCNNKPLAGTSASWIQNSCFHVALRIKVIAWFFWREYFCYQKCTFYISLCTYVRVCTSKKTCIASDCFNWCYEIIFCN